MDTNKITDVANQISRLVNNMSFSNKEREIFAEAILIDHRTLQQNTFRLFLAVIKKWSEVEAYDDRNMRTVLASRAIMEVLEEKNMTHIPYI